MIQDNDIVTLLVTIDLGILAAALAILAVFSVVSARTLIKADDALTNKADRKSAMSSLMFAGVFALVAMVILLLDLMANMVPARPEEGGGFGDLLVSVKLAAILGIWALRSSGLFTLAAVATAGRAGFIIFKLTRTLP